MNRRIALAFVLLGFAVPARGEMPERPYSAVVYKHETWNQPQPQKIHVVGINLADPNVQVRVSRGGPDPDGAGEWQTTLMPPTKIAEREEFDVVINGDFFAVQRELAQDGKQKAVMYQGGAVSKVSGPAVTDGEKWAPANEPRAALLIGPRNKPAVLQVQDPPSDAQQVIAGSHVIVQNGRNVAPPGDKPGFARGPHPRTAVGIADGGKTLLLVVVDGRKKGVAYGMSLQELGDLMLKYGAHDAVNLDGGGSSMIAIRHPRTGKIEILNDPSDGRERSVANVLGVSVQRRAPRAAPTTPPQR